MSDPGHRLDRATGRRKRDRAPDARSYDPLGFSLGVADVVFSSGDAGKSLPSPYEVLEPARLGYVKNPIVSACVKALATSASEPKLEVVRPGPDGDEPVPDTHPEAELLAFPNREQESYDFLHEFLTHYRVAGNAFIHILEV